VFTHSVWAADLFRSDLDRIVFLRELARATAKSRWTCLAFCLMHTHYHLIVEVDDGALPIGMHALNFRYAVGFNQRHRMKGHVLGAQYDSRRLDADSHLLMAFRYVARNPVEAQLCAAPTQWPWSSYPSTVGAAGEVSFVDASRVLGCFDAPREIAVARLRAFVENT